MSAVEQVLSDQVLDIEWTSPVELCWSNEAG